MLVNIKQNVLLEYMNNIYKCYHTGVLSLNVTVFLLKEASSSNYRTQTRNQI